MIGKNALFTGDQISKAWHNSDQRSWISFEEELSAQAANSAGEAPRPTSQSAPLYTKQQMIDFAAYHSFEEYNDEKFSEASVNLERWLKK